MYICKPHSPLKGTTIIYLLQRENEIIDFSVETY